MLLSPETVIQERYIVQRLIAQGGMGAVYEATDQRLGTTVALKQILLTDAIDPDQADSLRKAFEREARLLANLDHPSLPSVSDYFTDSHGQFLIMQFIPGDDLGTMLEQNSGVFVTQEGVTQVLRWADQLLDALDYLHRRQPPVIHRDIKPTNLKPTPQGDIVLLDFGIAKGSTGHTVHSAPLQSVRAYTVEYAPLEQMQGTGTDPRSDLYALAATLYHLLTNSEPPNALARAAAMLSGQADPLRPAHTINRIIPPALSLVLHQALEPRLTHRFLNARAMRHAIQSALQSHAYQTANVFNDDEDIDSSGEATIVMVASENATYGATTHLPNVPAAPPPRQLVSPLEQVLIVAHDDRGTHSTLCEALADASPGARIIMLPGTYVEHVTIDKPVEILGDGPVETIILQSTNITSYAPIPCLTMATAYARVRGITLIGTQGKDGESPASVVEIPCGRFVLEDCIITESGTERPYTPTACIRIHGATTDPLIHHCTIHQGCGHGIAIFDGARGTIEDCDIGTHAGSGVVIHGQGNPILRRCKVHHATEHGILIDGRGNGIIAACDISDNGHHGIQCIQESNPLIVGCTISGHAHGYGIALAQKSTGLVEACSIARSSKAGIAITHGANPLIRQCTVYQSKQWGILISQKAIGTIDGCDIATNGKAGVSIAQGATPLLRRCRIHDGQQAGVMVWDHGLGTFEKCAILNNAHAGVIILQEGNPVLRQCAINHNGLVAVLVRESGRGSIEGCDVSGNSRGTWYIEEGSDVRRVRNRE